MASIRAPIRATRVSAPLATCLALLLALGACNGRTAPDAASRAPESGSEASQAPEAGVTCPVVYDADALAQIQARGTETTLGFRVEALGPQIQCVGASGSFRRGYSELSVFPKLRTAGGAEIVASDNEGGAETLLIPIEIQELTAELKRELGARLGARAAPDAVPGTLVERQASPELALLGDLPMLAARIEPAQPGSGSNPLVARVSFDPALEREVRALLPQLESGAAAATLIETRAERGRLPEILAFEARRGSGAAFGDERGYSSAELAAELWNRARGRGRDERRQALATAAAWLIAMPEPRDQALARLGEARDYARSLWWPSPSAAGVRPDNAGDLVAALDFLNALDPADPTRDFAAQVAVIRAYFGNDSAALLREAIVLAQSRPFTPEQQALVAETADALLSSGIPTDAGSWGEAKSLARRAGFDRTRIQLALGAARWLAQQGIPGARPIASAEDYVLVRELTPEQWELFRSVTGWLRNGAVPEAADAVSRAETYLFQRRLTRAQAAVLFEAFRWLAGDSGPGFPADRALSRAENYVFARRLAFERLILMELAHTWLRDYPGPALGNSDAVSRAESYVLDRSATADGLDLLKASFSWLTSGDGPALSSRNGLSRAEEYVFSRGLNSVRLTRLQDSFRNLAQYLPRDQALQLAEQQVF